MMVFHTASFFNIDEHRGLCFSIAFGQPKNSSFPSLDMLKPNIFLLSDYREKRIGANEYARRYSAEVLSKTTPQKILDEISTKYPDAKVSDVTLLCWEPTRKFCHRQLAIDWLRDYTVRVGSDDFYVGNRR